MIKKISVLGSTGSIGTQTLEIARYNQDIGITALAACGAFGKAGTGISSQNRLPLERRGCQRA